MANDREFGAPTDGYCVRRFVPGVLQPPGEPAPRGWARACLYKAGRRVWQGPKRSTSKAAWADAHAAQAGAGAAPSDPEPDNLPAHLPAHLPARAEGA